jgi:SAGA-associated factor 29
MSSSVGGGGGGGAASAGADVAGLLDKAKELDQLRKEQDDVATEINKIHKKIISCKCLPPVAVPSIVSPVRSIRYELLAAL